MEAFKGLYLFGLVFLLVLGVAWFFMPFAIFGTKPILKDILRELKNNNDLLRTIASHAKDQADWVKRAGVVVPDGATGERAQAAHPIVFARPDESR